MNQVTEQEIVEIVKAHLSKMGWEYASHPELKPMFDLYTRIEAHGISLPDGMVLVPKEPTDKMIDAAYEAENLFATIYRAMLDAAP